MKVPRVGESIEIQTLQLLRSMILSDSRSQQFYGFLLGQHLNGIATCSTNLLSRAQAICNKHNISLMLMLCDEKYIREKRIFSRLEEQDGLAETVRYLSDNLNNESRNLINALLSPFQREKEEAGSHVIFCTKLLSLLSLLLFCIFIIVLIILGSSTIV